MGEVIPLPLPASRCPAERSGDSAELPRPPLASVVPLQSRRPKIRAGCGPAGTTSRRAGKADQGRGPFVPETTKFQICPEGLAFRDSIMDDKSMQGWTNLQLTIPGAHRTIGVVGRPTKPTSPATYRAQFFERVRTARKLYTDHPPTMAEALGVDKGTYYRYETRLMLPHHLIPLFCEITGVPMDWLMKGPDASRATAPLRKAAGSDHT
jgi:hypothetical protein